MKLKEYRGKPSIFTPIIFVIMPQSLLSEHKLRNAV